jgi:Na+-transporting methylmalonyl-CoA/oxaloacetate decarboxylase gamma subunit
MVLLAVTAETWIVTGLGFGIVLVLLFCLVFILQFFGWIMQKATAPRAPKPEKAAPAPGASSQSNGKSGLRLEGLPSPEPTDEGTKVAIAMSLAQAGDEDIAAIAYALHLARFSNHDIPTAMISLNQHETAWNTKSVGMNNVGF